MARLADNSVRRPATRQCAAVAWACALLLFVGCSSGQYLTIRKAPRDPLNGPLQLLSYRGPQPTARTESLLRRYDLEELQQTNPGVVLASLDQEIGREPTSEKFYAFAELAYVTGKSAEREGNERKALDCYGAAVSHAYLFLFDPRLDRARNPYDPQFRQACDIYNGALEAALRIWRQNNRLHPGMNERMKVAGREIELVIDVKGDWPADEIVQLEFVSDFEVTGLTNRHHTYGLGVPMIGVRRPKLDGHPMARYYPKVLAFPVTAFLRVEHLTDAWNATRTAATNEQHSPAPLRCVLELHDPLQSSDIHLAKRWIPLETDLSTPLAYLLDRPALRAKQIATFGFFEPAEAEAIKGIYMLEPYQPQKIPVIMVHGLWSSPMTWMEMFNDLRAMPEIRERYQFWFYLYPTGQPFWTSANAFRNDLNELLRLVDPQQANPILGQSVLVGHSMGGLVSMWQTLESGDHVWRLASDTSFDKLKAPDEVKSRLASMVYFQPNPAVSRVITIGTPHMGSDFANDVTRWLSHKLVDMPNRMLQTRQQLLVDNPEVIRRTDLFTITTSIDSLSPGNPVFRAMQRMTRAPWVKYHNVAGIVPSGTLLGRFSHGSDGVVAFESAHLEEADSELVVEADHTHVHRHPRSILEVRRILLEHAADFQARQASRAAELAPAGGTE